MKRVSVFLLFLGLLFLGGLVWKIGLPELGRELGVLGWGLIPIILCEGLADFLHTVAWRHCLTKPYCDLSLLRLFRIRMAGFAINYLTPTASVGGEVAKAVLLASSHRGPEAVSGVLIGKFCFAFAHLLFVVVGSILLLGHLSLPAGLWGAMFFSSALVSIGMIGFLLVQKKGKLGAIVRWLAARNIGGKFSHTAARHISAVDDALKLFYRERPHQLAYALAWHCVAYSLTIVQTWIFFRLVGQDASLVMAATAALLGLWFDLLTFAVPLNLGSLEGTRIVTLKALGCTALLGLTYGFAIRFAQLFWAVFGLFAYWGLTAESKPALQSPPK